MKECRKCGKCLDIAEFHVHKQMFDGRLNYCKSCVKERVTNHRQENIERIRAYDRKRGRTEKRKAGSRRYSRGRGREIVRRSQATWLAKNGHQKKANTAVGNAVRDGRLERKSCWCGAKGEGHHADYSKPLDVQWLCRKHHAEIHRRYA